MAVDSVVGHNKGNIISSLLVYIILGIALIFFAVPLYIMLVNSFKPLGEITSGQMVQLPVEFTIEPWLKAWSEAQIGVQAHGLKPYFINSFKIVIPAVAISTFLGAINGYVLTKWRFRGCNLIFASLLIACFIPFQVVIIPAARVLGALDLFGTIPGLVLIHVVYGIGFTTLFFRNYYLHFPNVLIKAAQIDGAGFYRIFFKILLPNSWPIIIVTVIWQFTNVWNDFLFGVSFSNFSSLPVTVALNNLVASSTGVKEYNVHFAGAIIAAIPTLIVYILSGRFFVRGLMAGAVKG